MLDHSILFSECCWIYIPCNFPSPKVNITLCIKLEGRQEKGNVEHINYFKISNAFGCGTITEVLELIMLKSKG